ncbi:MAG: fatty acid cis/trans isomerase [Thermodesulfobacteriota bacterium]|nr:fatty acid cis/trans isomerase [Thermodesulfobacteriota bacterium]
MTSKYINFSCFSSLLVLLAGCAAPPPPPVQVQIPDRRIDYVAEVKPLLDKRCVVCHSCYNSPCQLKLSAYEGVDRGGTKNAVYNSTRLTTMDPTRLFIDAQTTEQWRQKDFFSVTDNSAQSGYNNSIMLQLLSHKMVHPKSSGTYNSEAVDLTCAKNQLELGSYLEKHPNRGMPFGFPPLTQEVFKLFSGWLAQGANGPTPEQQNIIISPKPEDAAKIKIWENFLNTPDPKHAMTARYLYEHFFLAHLKFDTSTNEYYELVRSKTPSGEIVDLINTVRPYDDPGTEQFYYRFRKIHSTIVHKTHMVVNFDNKQLARFKELFITPKWLQEPHLVDYDQTTSANPFVSFEQIPVRSRYQFLLDNSHYIIMTFIRGPVCRGQVALNVIHDHFWVMFMDPEYDLSVKNPGFMRLNRDNLIMPIEKGSKFGIRALIKNKYHQAIMRYFKSRQDFYAAGYYNGLGYEAIWKGNRPEDAPLLTVYRHFDSASVQRGVRGELPSTMWVIDYPLLERIYYALVAGFDVYGTLGHQLAIRLYMDTLRVEGETYFLNFMPEDKRREMIDSWYLGVKNKDIHTVPTLMPSDIEFTTNDPKREFIEHIVEKEIPVTADIKFDQVNYLPAGKQYPGVPKQYNTLDDVLQGFRAISAPGSALLSHFNNHSANLAYVRIRRDKGDDLVLSIVVNRWHANVTYLFGEKNVLDAAKDRADILPGFIGSYPNYFFNVHVSDLPDFLHLLSSKKIEEKDIERFLGYGINRANPGFWEEYDWFQQRFFHDQPIQAGRFDLNRYYPTAL